MESCEWKIMERKHFSDILRSETARIIRAVFNGPVGLRGVHPATPYMGSAEVRWTKGKPLIIDNGFTLAGYMTDKTQVYWLGDKEAYTGKCHEGT